ncbi:MAG TPA: hypothetical protein P5244_15845 [Syntrophales bacterium]|nr:hypothetical protein [Syntrophobacterales bacterium]HRR42704.1 hypothetical protein [Syntrophales bacterium]HRT27594.1 hypothetical protein [Syntrophales bacterium]HRT70822.1 hypothetical protein [Syntrophales bacterium]
MKAFRMNKYIICAELLEEAKEFFVREIGEALPADIDELSWDCEVCSASGETRTLRDIINGVMDERSAWLRMGIPCDLLWPFIAAKTE